MPKAKGKAKVVASITVKGAGLMNSVEGAAVARFIEGWACTLSRRGRREGQKSVIRDSESLKRGEVRLVIHGAPRFSTQGTRSVCRWLRSRAKDLRTASTRKGLSDGRCVFRYYAAA